jgi:hypothetical protein
MRIIKNFLPVAVRELKEEAGMSMKTSRPCREYRGQWRGNADTGPGFKARTRISRSCLGHPAGRREQSGRLDW